MGEYLTQIKVIVAVVLSFIADVLGGWDAVLSLLVSLILADLLTGVLKAVITKTVSSTEMRNGMIRKLMIFVIIFVACRVDKVIMEASDGGIVLFGVEVYIRTLFIIYSCLEESISLIENLAKIGVPFPKAIRQILVQVAECADSSLPKAVIKWLKDKFNINIEKKE